MVEYLRQHSTVPFLVVQPENVRNDRLRLTSDRDASERHRSTHADAASAATRGDGKGLQLATSPPALATVAEDDEDGDDAAVDDDEDDGLLFPVDGTSTPAARLLEGHTRPRKIAIAYEHDATGQLLLSFAARVVLQPHDSVLLVHCTANKRGDHHAQSSTAHGGGLAGSLQQPSQEGNVGSLSAKSLASSGKGDDLHAGDSFSSKHHDGASVSSRSLPSGDLAGREPSGCMPRSGGVAGVCGCTGGGDDDNDDVEHDVWVAGLSSPMRIPSHTPLSHIQPPFHAHRRWSASQHVGVGEGMMPPHSHQPHPPAHPPMTQHLQMSCCRDLLWCTAYDCVATQDTCCVDLPHKWASTC